MKKSDLEQIIKEEIARYISEVIAEHVVNETIRKIGNKYVVYAKKGGKRLGTHTTRKSAQKQLAAIEISKHKKGK